MDKTGEFSLTDMTEHPALTSHGGAIDISQGNFDIPQELDGYDPTARYLRTVA